MPYTKIFFYLVIVMSASSRRLHTANNPKDTCVMTRNADLWGGIWWLLSLRVVGTGWNGHSYLLSALFVAGRDVSDQVLLLVCHLLGV